MPDMDCGLCGRAVCTCLDDCTSALVYRMRFVVEQAMFGMEIPIFQTQGTGRGVSSPYPHLSTGPGNQSLPLGIIAGKGFSDDFVKA